MIYKYLPRQLLELKLILQEITSHHLMKNYFLHISVRSLNISFEYNIMQIVSIDFQAGIGIYIHIKQKNEITHA